MQEISGLWYVQEVIVGSLGTATVYGPMRKSQVMDLIEERKLYYRNQSENPHDDLTGSHE